MTNSEMSPEEIVALIGKDTVLQIYKDSLSNPLSEVSSILTDLIKTVRLFTAPLQVIATLQERLQKYLKQISDRVPPDKIISPDTAYSGQIIQKLTFIDDNHYLKDYYLNLLEKSINADHLNIAHPAFPSIIQQLSPDEIKLLEFMKENDIESTYAFDIVDDGKYENEELLETNCKPDLLYFPEHRRMYLDHLQILNLTRIKKIHRNNRAHEGYQSHTRKNKVELSDFGLLFMKACSRI